MKKFLLASIVLLFGVIHTVAGGAELQGVTVALVSPSWNTGLPTAVARSAGFFKEEGLDVRPVTLSSSGPIMMALLMSGHADLVVAGAVAILRGISQNAPVVVGQRSSESNELRAHERQGLEDGCGFAR
jgi:ABC-type nitrate/sulfonate/bicarbonate transport system substrate-binding protein